MMDSCGVHNLENQPSWYDYYHYGVDNQGTDYHLNKCCKSGDARSVLLLDMTAKIKLNHHIERGQGHLREVRDERKQVSPDTVRNCRCQ